MEGVDIPKIYIGNITSKKKKLIIDGGHRTRAINGFMQNEYPLEIDEKKIYYSKTPVEKDMRNISVMSEDEKRIIKNYVLSITIYESITESDSSDDFPITFSIFTLEVLFFGSTIEILGRRAAAL